MNLARASRRLKLVCQTARKTSNLHNAESTVKLWVDEQHKVGQKFVRRSEHEFCCDNKGHIIVTVGEYSLGGPQGVWRHGVSLYWGPNNPLNYIDNISHTALGVTLRKKVAWESCIGLSMQYSRELNMKAIRTAAETARFIGMDAITITTTNYNIINAFNSVDHVGSLLHGFKNGIGSVARKNWYTMVSMSGIKVFICRLENMDAKARLAAIDGQSSSMLKKFGKNKQIAPQTQDLIGVTSNLLERVWREHRYDGKKTVFADNIRELRNEINDDNYWYLTRQISADLNTQRIHNHRRSQGIPIVPVHSEYLPGENDMAVLPSEFEAKKDPTPMDINPELVNLMETRSSKAIDEENWNDTDLDDPILVEMRKRQTELEDGVDQETDPFIERIRKNAEKRTEFENAQEQLLLKTSEDQNDEDFLQDLLDDLDL